MRSRVLLPDRSLGRSPPLCADDQPGASFLLMIPRQLTLMSVLYHIASGEQGAQRRIEMVELLDVLVWYIVINQLLRLDMCANLQLAAEQLDVPAVLWSPGEQFERQDILGFRDIHLEHYVGAP